MGVETSVDFPETLPDWETVRLVLDRHRVPVQLRMADGQLTFPDESPKTPWSELRVGTPEGMITIRRDGLRLAFVTWGNATPLLLEWRNALMWAFADSGEGKVNLSEGSVSAGDFLHSAALPREFRHG